MKMNNENFFTRLARLAMLNVGFGSPSNSARTENLVNYVAFGGIPNLPFKQIFTFFWFKHSISDPKLDLKDSKANLESSCIQATSWIRNHIRAVENNTCK